MRIKDTNIRIFAILFSMLGALYVSSVANADDRIRLNPNYKGPSEQNITFNNNEIVTEELGQDFIQFLDTPEDDDQYILLKEPEGGNRPIISLNDNKNTGTSIIFEHEYLYSPSLSFDISSPLAGYTGTNLLDHNVGGSRAVFSLGANDKNNQLDNDSTVKFFIGSSYIQPNTNRYSMLLQDGLLGQQAYNMSLGIGYSGFQLGASFSRNNNLLTADLSGYDLGLGYTGANWSANMRFGEYNSGPRALITSDLGMFDNMSAYELGAAYQLFPNINLTGRFTYYSYGVGSEVMPIDDVKSLIFGTNFSF